MKALVSRMKKLGDTFVKAYLLSLMINFTPVNQNQKNNRY